jgi:hypothetical protein
VIAFITLFLGIATGVHTVELSAASAVARVELYVDGTKSADVGPPFTATIDLGPEIAPRELVAVAFDATGNRLGEARQHVNRATSDAEAGFALERDGTGRVLAARLFWRCPVSPKPTVVSVSLDGRPLEVANPERIPIPSHGAGSEHILVADLTFDGGLTATAVASFGGRNRGDEAKELTALPVRLSPGARFPRKADRMDGWFQLDGRGLAVAAVEEGPVEIVFVMAGRAAEDLMRLATDLVRADEDRREVERLTAGRIAPQFGRPAGGDFAIPRPSRRSPALALELPAGSRFHFTRTTPRVIAGPREVTWAFPTSAVFTPRDGTFLHLGKDVFRSEEPSPPRIAEAIAASGLAATRRERRRAVVLLLGTDARDTGNLDAPRVRRYLERLRVPLHVWRVALMEPPAAKDWPGAAEAVTTDSLGRAMDILRTDLASQRVVWVEGRLDALSVEATPSAEGVVTLR